MLDKTIVSIGLAAALAAAAMTSQARAEPVAGIFAAGIVLGTGIASMHHRRDIHHSESAVVWDHGVPGYQRPRPLLVSHAPAGYALVEAPGPGRHRVCARQDRYDRHEHYIGSRRICWIEAR
ncbi:MAG: hypothetical protein OEL76_01800 [Siculibacillus sp.]|nr:hypothetical protein [Siculibacillus sp.]